MTKQRTAPIQIRASESAVKELDIAAERNGRSRNAEASARLEASLIGESPYPEDMALVTFVNFTTAKIGGIVGVAGPEHRGPVLTMLKGALCAVLDALGAVPNEASGTLGASAGNRIIEDARRAMGKPARTRTPEEDALASAATTWGLEAIKGKDDQDA